MTRAKMIRLVNRDRPSLGGAGPDSIGALGLLAPLRADDQPRLDEHPLEHRIDFRAENHPVGVGEQQRVAGPCDLFVKRVHLGARDLHQVFIFGV